MSTCKECRFFRPTYHHIGRCDRQLQPNSKLFTDDNKAGILVHVTFGCVQFKPQPAVEEDTI